MKTVQLLIVCLLSPIAANFARAQTTGPGDKKAPAEQGLFGASGAASAADESAKGYAEAVKREEMADRAYHDALARTLQRRQEIRDKAGRVDITNSSIMTAASKLDHDLQTLRLEQAGAEARMKALEDAVATQTTRVEKASSADTVIAELEKVADAREKQLKLVENERKTGTITDAALQDAIAALAEARAKTAERRQTVFMMNGGDTLGALNRELLNLSIGDQERRAKIDFLQAQLQKLMPVLDSSYQLQFQERELNQAMTELQQARGSLRQWQIEMSEKGDKPASPQTKPSQAPNEHK